MNPIQLKAIKVAQSELCGLQPTVLQTYLQQYNMLTAAECSTINQKVVDEQKIIALIDIIKRKSGSWNLLNEFLKMHNYYDLADGLESTCREFNTKPVLPTWRNEKSWNRSSERTWAIARHWKHSTLSVCSFAQILFLFLVIVAVVASVGWVKCATTSSRRIRGRLAVSVHTSEAGLFDSYAVSSEHSASICSGYNLITMVNGEFLYIDISSKNATLYKRSMKEAESTIFQPQPSGISETTVLFNRFGIPGLLMISKHRSSCNKVRGVSHLVGDKWQFHALEKAVLFRNAPIFTQDPSFHFYTFSATAKQTCILWYSHVTGDQPVPVHSLENFRYVAGVLVVQLQIFLFYTTPLESSGVVWDLVMVNASSGFVASRKRWALRDPTWLDPGCTFKETKFKSNCRPHLHIYNGEVIAAHISNPFGEFKILNLDSWEWRSRHMNAYSSIPGFVLSAGSTVTGDGILIVGWKYKHDAGFRMKETCDLKARYMC